jgi:hypothetical protein
VAEGPGRRGRGGGSRRGDLVQRVTKGAERGSDDLERGLHRLMEARA